MSDKVVVNNMKSDAGTIEFSRGSTQQSIQQTNQTFQQQTVQQQPNNIILVRGSRAENGQIILQNTHELLSLLSEDDKPVLLQHPRIKTKNEGGGTILFQQSSMKNNTMDGGTILLQSSNMGMKKNPVNSDGSITLQQRINKNGTTDGTFLLQTLKRLDKSQSILVIRNNNTATMTSTSTLTSTQTKKAVEEDNKPEVVVATVAKSTNVPLGCGE